MRSTFEQRMGEGPVQWQHSVVALSMGVGM
jgi:hypothetical protein